MMKSISFRGCFGKFSSWLILSIVGVLIIQVYHFQNWHKISHTSLEGATTIQTSTGSYLLKVYIPLIELETLRQCSDFQSGCGNNPSNAFLAGWNMHVYRAALVAGATFCYNDASCCSEKSDVFLLVRDFVIGDVEKLHQELSCHMRVVLVGDGFNDISPSELRVGMTLFRPNRWSQKGVFLPTNDRRTQMSNIHALNLVVEPMGVLSDAWDLPFPKNSRRILLDEFHPYSAEAIVERNFDLSVPYQYALEHEAMLENYKYMLQVMEILASRGWQIDTFVGRNVSAQQAVLEHCNVNFSLNVTTINTPADYKKMWESGRYVFYASHVYETYGVPLFESLQAGIPIIAFAEHAPPLMLLSMKNSVLCSTACPISLFADLIESYYDNIYTKEIHEAIKKDSTALYSAETWLVRLKSAMVARGFNVTF